MRKSVKWILAVCIVIVGFVVLWHIGVVKAYKPERVDTSADGCTQRILYNGRYSYKSICK